MVLYAGRVYAYALGNVSLTSLSLKRDALDDLDLPIEIVRGYVGELRLEIPWANLKSKPVIIYLNNVLVQAVPVEGKDPERFIAKLLRDKLEKLSTSELLRASAARVPINTDQQAESFTTSLINKIIDNLQISIKNIHIRFQDTDRNFSIGLCLAELKAFSVDKNGNECFITEKTSAIFKSAGLSRLFVYSDRKNADEVHGGSWLQEMAETIDSNDLSFLLRPVNGVCMACIQKHFVKETPKVSIKLRLEEFGIVMNEEQFLEILLVIQRFILLTRRQNYLQFRPTAPISQSPKDWVAYSFKTTLKNVKLANHQRSVDYIMERRKQRKEYVELYKSKITGRMGNLERTRLEGLETALQYQDIQLYRVIARRELQSGTPSSPISRSPNQAVSWRSYFWGYGGNANKSESSLDGPKPEEVEELLNTINFDGQIEQVDDPRSIRYQVSLSLDVGKMSLLDARNGLVVELLFNTLLLEFTKRLKSMRVDVKLQDLCVTEGVTQNQYFHNVLKSKADKFGAGENGADDAKGFISASFDTLTDSETYSSSLTLLMNPLIIIVNHEAARKLVDYVFAGDRGRAIKSLSETAANKITQLKARTLAHLQYALSQHQSTELNLVIDAPLLYFPLSCDRMDVPLFIIDLGSICVKSKSIPISKRNELIEKYKNVIIKGDTEELFDVLYDQAIVSLSQARAFYANSITEWSESTSSACDAIDANHLVLDKMNLDLIVGSCIVKKVEGLVETKVWGNLPPFTLHFTDQKWKSFMALIDVLMGKAGHGETAPEPPAQEPVEEGFFDALDEPAMDNSGPKTWEKCKLAVNVSFEKVSALIKGANKGSDGETLFGSIIAEKLFVKANIFPKNISVVVVLEQFGIYDNRNNSEYSGPIVEGKTTENSDIDTSLLRVTVDYIDEDHPLFFTRHEGVRINVGIDISDVQLYLEPENFFTHIRYIVDTFSEDDETMLHNLSLATASDNLQSKSAIKVNASVSEIICSLGRNASCIAEVVAKRAVFRAHISRKREIILNGSLYSIDIVNKRPTLVEYLDGRHFISNYREGNLAQFAFQTFPKGSPLIDPNAPDSKLTLSAGSLKITYMPIFLKELLSFVNNVKLSMNIVTRKPSNIESKMRIFIELESPVLELVREPRPKIFRPIMVYLGHMKMSNQYEGPITRQFLTIAGFRIEALTGPQLDSSVILQDASINLEIEQNNKAIELKLPSNIVKGTIDRLDFHFGLVEYNLFLSRVFHFLDTVSPALDPWFNPPGSIRVITSSSHVLQDVNVSIQSISINLLKESIESQCFASLRFDECAMSVKMFGDTSMELNILCKDFTLIDPRNEHLPFGVIVPLLHSIDMPRLSATYSRDSENLGIIKARLEAIEIIFALNYVFAIKSYLIDNMPPRSDIQPYDPNAKPLFQVYDLNNLRLYLIENPNSSSSEALRISIDCVTFSSRDNASVIIDNLVGSFVNMDMPVETELQLIEPLDINCSIEYEKVKGVAVKTTYSLTFDQLVARLSSEDYLFVQSVWNQFLTNVDSSSYVQKVGTDEIVVANILEPSTVQPKIGREKLLICCNLVRLVLIDDLSRVNIPFCDISLEKIELELLDWSGDTSLDANIHVASNSFNLNNSHWEPLIEPTVFHIMSKKSGNPSKSDIVISSEKNVDLVLTHPFVSSLYKLWNKMSMSSDQSGAQLRTADRQVSRPYKIFNYTGYPLAIWNDADSDPELVNVEPDASVSWSFEDWRVTRRMLGSQTAKLSLQLLGSEWESLKGIAIDKIGAYVYNLRPKIDGIHHKLTCEIVTAGSIKHVFIRPSIVLKNRTKFNLRAISENLVDGQSSSIDIASNSYSAFPIKFSHNCAFRLKPTDMEYDPTTSAIDVSRLVELTRDDSERGKRTSVQVKSTSSIPDVAPFYFLVYSVPLAIRSTRDYPVANLVIRAPIELHNLIPKDIRFRMYDLDSKYDFGGSVAAGKVAPLHAIRSDHLVGLSIEIDGTDWRSAEVASINCAERDYHDDEMRLKAPSGKILNLRVLLEYSLFSMTKTN